MLTVTGAIDQFTYGVANRGASIRIPREVGTKGYGYFEDRRPASNADPYRITGIIMETYVLSELLRVSCVKLTSLAACSVPSQNSSCTRLDVYPRTVGCPVVRWSVLTRVISG